ncbi:MAG: MFS transporter [Salibacteraceae bacterium]
MKSNKLLREERIILYLLAAMQFIHIVDFMIIMPLGETLTRTFDITIQQFSLLVAAYSLGAGICSLVGAFYIDRFDRKPVLLFLFFGFLLGTLFCGLSPTYEILLTSRILTGAFGGVLAGLLLSVLGDVVPNERRGKAMGVLMAAFSLAAFLGVPLGLYLSAQFNWHTPFFGLAGLGVVILVGVWRFIPSLRGHLEQGQLRESPLQIIGNVLRSANQKRALIFYMLLIFGQFLMIPFIAPFMEINVGFSKHQVLLVYTVGGMATFFSAPLIGHLVDRFGRAKIFTILVFCSLVPMLWVPNLGPEVVMGYMATTLVFVFFSGRMIPATTMMTSAVDQQHRGSFMGISTSMRELTMGLASFTGGLIIVENTEGLLQNYHYAGFIAVAISLIAIPIGRRLRIMDEAPPAKNLESKISEPQANPVK